MCTATFYRSEGFWAFVYMFGWPKYSLRLNLSFSLKLFAVLFSDLPTGRTCLNKKNCSKNQSQRLYWHLPVCYVCLQMWGNTRVTVRTVKQEEEEEGQHLLRQELEALSQLKHPNILLLMGILKEHQNRTF